MSQTEQPLTEQPPSEHTVSERRGVESTSQSLSLEALDQALRLVRARVAPDITAQRLLILLAVHFHEGLSQRELLDWLDSTSITALSRNLADLSALTSRKTEGPGLIELRVDPMNLRVKRVYLTRKGKRLVADLAAALENRRQGLLNSSS